MQPVKSYGLAETLGIIGKYNVLSTRIKWQEKKQTRGRQRPTTESSGGPLKTIGKTRFWHTNRKYPFTADWPWQEKKQPQIWCIYSCRHDHLTCYMTQN